MGLTEKIKAHFLFFFVNFIHKILISNKWSKTRIEWIDKSKKISMLVATNLLHRVRSIFVRGTKKIMKIIGENVMRNVMECDVKERHRKHLFGSLNV